MTKKVQEKSEEENEGVLGEEIKGDVLEGREGHKDDIKETTSEGHSL